MAAPKQASISMPLQRERRAMGARLGAYLALMKPRVMSLVVFTAVVGMVLAPSTLSPLMAGLAVLCIALGAGAAGALNMWYDRDIDGLMQRTSARPIPTGRVTPHRAAAFGIGLSMLSVGGLGWVAGWLAAGLLALTIAYYFFVYTAWLKRRTAQSVVIGGVAGALPPLIGWAAASGGIAPTALVLFAIIFLWTPPHSWALALFKGEEMAQASLPSLLGQDRVTSAKRQIALYSLLLVPVTLLPGFPLGTASLGYLVPAVVLGLLFLHRVWRLLTASPEETNRRAGALFGYSILYLFLLFAALLVDHILAGYV